MKKVLHVDIETFSSVDLSNCGVYRYAESRDFRILLIGYAYDDDPVTVLDLTHEYIPYGLKQDIQHNPEVTKVAHNAAFEMTCFGRYFGRPVDPAEWEDTMLMAAACGLPMSLGGVGAALGLPEDKQKDAEGKRLLRFFSTPCEPTLATGMQPWHIPQEAPEKWQRYIEYNRQDVVAEREIYKRLTPFALDKDEMEAWQLDQAINRRGVRVDTRLTESALHINDVHTEKLMTEMRKLTGLKNPNSLPQLKGWLGITGALNKETVADMLANATGVQKRVLEIRRELGKSSVAKYEAIKRYLCADERVHGLFQFYGAGRTGRFAGRGPQLQNLPQNHIDDLDTARETALTGDEELLETLYGDVPDTLSQLIRTAFIPRDGCTFAVADFSAIEARVIAWLADEQWRVDLFARGGDIYCQSASQMFHVPVEKHGVNGHLRQKGKIAELACIAQGSKVLTNHGLKRIEKVTENDMVFDGEHFVQHGGVVFRGYKRVIYYEGLNATPDHIVYLDPRKKVFGSVELQNAKASGLHLWHPHSNRSTATDLREGINYLIATYDILNCGPWNRYTVSNCVVHNCGYGGSVGALKNFGALKMGLKEEELQPIVDAWREASPNIVQLWYDVGDAVMNAVKYGEETHLRHGLRIYRTKKLLCIELPSGRTIRYFDPKITENKFGKPSVSYMATEQKQWVRVESYGPKFVENIIQGMARDCLMVAMKRVAAIYPDIVMHIHDEMVVEVPTADAERALKQICFEMGRPIPWAPGLLLRGDGYVTPYYKKD